MAKKILSIIKNKKNNKKNKKITFNNNVILFKLTNNYVKKDKIKNYDGMLKKRIILENLIIYF